MKMPSECNVQDPHPAIKAECTFNIPSNNTFIFENNNHFYDHATQRLQAMAALAYYNNPTASYCHTHYPGQSQMSSQLTAPTLIASANGPNKSATSLMDQYAGQPSQQQQSSILTSTNINPATAMMFPSAAEMPTAAAQALNNLPGYHPFFDYQSASTSLLNAPAYGQGQAQSAYSNFNLADYYNSANANGNANGAGGGPFASSNGLNFSAAGTDLLQNLCGEVSRSNAACWKLPDPNSGDGQAPAKSNSSSSGQSLGNFDSSNDTSEMGQQQQQRLSLLPFMRIRPNPPYRIGPGTNNVRVRTKEVYRVVYNEYQREELEKEFIANQFITAKRKADLSSSLQLTERQIKIWFQNRRAKDRRRVKGEKEKFVVSLNMMGIDGAGGVGRQQQQCLMPNGVAGNCC